MKQPGRQNVTDVVLCSASSAVNKIHEACGQVLGLPLADVGVAIDLGALLSSPGGGSPKPCT